MRRQQFIRAAWGERMIKFSHFVTALCGSFIALVPRVAAADRVRPWQLEIDLGMRGNSDIFIADGRLYGGFALSPSRKEGSWLPFFGAGAYLSYGSSSVDDILSIEGTVRGNRYAVGLEARGGFAGHVGRMDHYVYLGLAPLYFGSSSQSKHLPEAGGALGFRSSLGFGAPGKWSYVFGNDHDQSSCGGDMGCGIALIFLFIVPNHIEFNYENVAGSSHRFGGTFGYSF